MLNDYKPTHDTSQDTFKVEYLVGGAAVMGILLPYSYRPSEVGQGTYPANTNMAHAVTRCFGRSQSG
jgi:hypothetical protein